MYSTQYGQQLVNQAAGGIPVQQPAARLQTGQNQPSAVNSQPGQPQQAIPQQLPNMPYQTGLQSTEQAYGDIGQQYGQLNPQLQSINNQVPIQSNSQYQVPVQQPGVNSEWARQQQIIAAYDKAQSAPVQQGPNEWNGQSQQPAEPYNSAAVQQNYPSKLNYNVASQLQQQAQPVIQHTGKTRNHPLPFEAQPPPQRNRNRGRPTSVADREGAVVTDDIGVGSGMKHPKQNPEPASSRLKTNKLEVNASRHVSESMPVSHNNDVSRTQKMSGTNKQGRPVPESSLNEESGTEKPVAVPDEYYRQYSPPYESGRHGLHGGYGRNRGPYNGGYLNNANGYVPEAEGYGQNDGYDLTANTLYGGNPPRNRLANGGRGQYLDYDQYFGDGMLNGLDPNLAYDYYPLESGIAAVI